MLYTPRARGEPLVAAGHFQRCPKPEENQVPVLCGARHVQEWLSPTRQVRPLWGHGPRKSREPVCVGWRSFQGRRHPAEFRRIHTRWPVERELGLFFFSLRLLRFQTTWCGAHLCSLTRQGRGARRFSHPRLPAPVPLQAPRLLIDEPNATVARMCQTQHLEQPVPWRAGTGCKSVPKAPAGAARRRPTVGSGGVPEWSRGPRSQ